MYYQKHNMLMKVYRKKQLNVIYYMFMNIHIQISGMILFLKIY